MDRKRTHISILLLTIFLSALLASSLHRHPTRAVDHTECAKCVHHLPHAGHLSSYAGPAADCVLCHFQGLPYLMALVATFFIATILISDIRDVSSRPAIAVFLRHLRPRAPPVSSLNLSLI